MTYAIAHVVYGYEIPGGDAISAMDDVNDSAKWLEVVDKIEEEGLHDEKWLSGTYSGSGAPSHWVGVVLGQFDECTLDLVQVRNAVNAVPSAAQCYEVTELWRQVPEWLQKELGPEPKVFLVWGTS